MPGITSSDANFEATFSDLAFARLRDKAPSLLDYLVGFQLIDKNEDETHAVSVFGFKVGSEWVYAPVFYINGELKGHELLYVKNQDAFVPMTEQWVNYILNRRPRVLGESEDTPRGELGMRQPNFDIFARAPQSGSKSASANHHDYAYVYERLKDYAKPAMQLFTVSPRHEKFASLDKRFTLTGMIELFGKQAAITLFNTMKHDTKFAESVLSFYDINDLIKAAENASPGVATKRKQESDLDEVGQKQMKGELNYPEPKVISDLDDPNTFVEDLSDADREKLMRDRYLFNDKRTDDQKTQLYKLQVPQTMNSPVKSGLYDVMTESGKSVKMLVLMNPLRTGWNSEPATLVIDPETKKYGIFHNSDVLTTAWYGKEEMEKFINALPSGDSFKTGDQGVLVTPCGIGTDVFRVENCTDTPDGRSEMRVYGITGSSPMSSFARNGGGITAPRYANSAERVENISFTGKDGTGFTQLGRTAFLPKDYKALVLKKGKASDRKNALSGPCDIGNQSQDLCIGSLNKAMTEIQKKAAWGEDNLYTLRVLNDGLGYRPVVTGQQANRSMSKIACLKYLVERLGLDGEDAELTIKESKLKSAPTYIMKLAFGAPPQQATFMEPERADEYGIKAPVQRPMTTSENLGQTEDASELYNNDRYIDDGAKQQASAASQLGQKEVLDTTVISGLVKTMDTDSAIDGYIGDLLLGLDRVGRILFMYYWHNDKFKERYGQQDMIELEDNLRNVFKNMGELSLFLKQKTIEPEQNDNSEAELTEVLS